jgi:hypothetical protein
LKRTRGSLKRRAHRDEPVNTPWVLRVKNEKAGDNATHAVRENIKVVVAQGRPVRDVPG